MATTRIIPMHIGKGKTIAKSLSDRIDYAINPDKTNGYELVTTYRCDYHTADAEFLLNKRKYDALHQRQYNNEILAYQIRQSFAPGEVTPEEANAIGYETAARLLKGKHAFIVATHINTNCIHNHIIYDAVSLDSDHKWKDVKRSHKDIARLSDIICQEHHLSVIMNPKNKGSAYNTTKYYKYNMNHRDRLRSDMDDILRMKPDSYNEFISLLDEMGYEIIKQKYTSIKHTSWKQGVSFYSLGKGYSEEHIKAVIAGTENHKPMDTSRFENRPQLISKLEDKMEGKSQAYRNRLSVVELKQMAKTFSFIREHKFDDIKNLDSAISGQSIKIKSIESDIKTVNEKIKEKEKLRQMIFDYSDNRDVYTQYREKNYGKSFYEKHKAEIDKVVAAKKYFNQLGFETKLPSVKQLGSEISELKKEKSLLYEELNKLKNEHREYLIHQANIHQMLDIDIPDEKSDGKKSVIKKMEEMKELVDNNHKLSNNKDLHGR